ncbi:transmembrane protein, putative [Medicago truncatula]|uniref:Transmembrane protein, putative n=1 Tax=Medicago truncatula TaxID=3880 RepID=A0A072TKM7_MEDTR|nr:transmembrane protein, putative [Medicago truncatula]
MTLSLLQNISGMGRKSSSQLINILCFNIILQLLACSRVQRSYSLEPQRTNNISIGAVLDLVSLMGKHQKIAMEIAVEEFNNQSSSSKLNLQIKDSHGNSAQEYLKSAPETLVNKIMYNSLGAFRMILN